MKFDDRERERERERRQSERKMSYVLRVTFSGSFFVCPQSIMNWNSFQFDPKIIIIKFKKKNVPQCSERKIKNNIIKKKQIFHRIKKTTTKNKKKLKWTLILFFH